MNAMKVTLEVDDALLEQARRQAAEAGRSLDALVEDGLRTVLPAPPPTGGYRLPDLSVGRPDATDPLEGYSWYELRDMSYWSGDEERARRRPVDTESLRARWEKLPPVDPAALRRDIDTVIDPSL